MMEIDLSFMDNQYYVIFYYLAFLFIFLFNQSCSFLDEKELYNIHMKIFYIGSPLLLSLYTLGFRVQYVHAIVSWWFFAWIISKIGGSVDYVTLSYGLVIFYSEYYELPIYLHRIMYNVDNFHIFSIVMKLMIIIGVCMMIKFMGFDYKDFIRHLIIFSIPYVVFGWIIVDVFGNTAVYLSPLILKLICLIDLVIYMVLNGWGELYGYN